MSLTAIGPELYYVVESWSDLLLAVQLLRPELLKTQRQALAGRALPSWARPRWPRAGARRSRRGYWRCGRPVRQGMGLAPARC
ncbi:MAG: hypothetical protein WKG07_42675 [Hymenobacter sp.]